MMDIDLDVFGTNNKNSRAKVIKLLEENLANLKEGWDRSYFSIHCFYHCLLAEELILSESKSNREQYQKKLQNEWRELWEYFAHTSLSDVYKRSAQIDEMLSKDLVKDFCMIKWELYLDLATMIEDEVIGYRDRHPDYIERLDMEPWLQKKLMMRVKWKIYKEYILNTYFPKKSGMESLKRFVYHVFNEKSIYIAIATSGIQAIKGLKTREDKIRFAQALHLYLEFTDETYFSIGEMPTHEILEYWLQMVRTDIMSVSSRTQLTEMLCHSLARVVEAYIWPYTKKEHEHIYELSLICHTVTLCTKHTIVPGKYLESQVWYKAKNEFKEFAATVWALFVQWRPMLEEASFYGDYEWRFDMDEYRIWDKMCMEMEDEEYLLAKKYLKQLNHHKWFFRYTFHLRSIEYNVLLNDAVDAYENGNHDVSRKNLQKIKDLVHIWRADIVRDYPHDQVEDVLEGLESADFMIAKLEAKLTDTYFDEEWYIEKMVKKQVERMTKKDENIKEIQVIWRNDPCFCGSEKKFKKCCGNPAKQKQL